MGTSSIIILATALLATALFVVLPRLIAKNPSRLGNQHFYNAPSLSLFASMAFIPMFALVEMAGRYGIAALMALIAFSLLDMLSPIILKPIQWFTNRHKISGITDILVYRFRGRSTGILISLILTITTLPLAVAMLHAASETLWIILGVQHNPPSYQAIVPLLILVISAGFVYTVHAHRTSVRHYWLPMHMASTIVIAGLLITTFAVVRDTFGDFKALDAWEEQRQLLQSSIRLEHGSALVAVFFGASLVFPQFYSIRSLARSESHISQTSWLFPMLLLLAALPMLPLLWSGIANQADIPLQFYASTLSHSLNLPWASFAATLAAVTACIAGLCNLNMNLTQPLVNYLAMPNKFHFGKQGLQQWLKRYNLIVMFLLMALWFAACSLVKSRSVTDLLLVSFCGLSQLAPAILATFYFPNINRLGVLCGLSAGLLLWLAGLFIPLFTGSWSVELPLGHGSLNLGMPYWSSIFYESLFLNIGLMLIVSRLSGMSGTEQFFARDCMVDNLPENYHMELQQRSIKDFRQGLTNTLGSEKANELVTSLLHKLELEEHENRPYQLRLFRHELAATLNSLIGTDASHRLISEQFPALSHRKIDNNYTSLKGILDATGSQLSGLSAELNKLRINHRKTLQHLPMGACVLDAAEEIISWNASMEQFTGIPLDQAQGARIEQLENPWCIIFADFLSSGKLSEHGIEIRADDNEKWCTLHRAIITHDDTSELKSQIVLLEDITEIMTLNRSLIHSERLASVGRLAAGVAHEIGNPVTGIACLAQDMEAYPDDHQSVREDARMIVEQTQRITRIVRSLTDFSRSHEQHETDDFDLSTIIHDAISLLELSNNKQVQFVPQVAAELAYHGNQHQLTQVLLNLLTNAYDVSQTGDCIHINAVRNGDTISIRVIDQGPGIPASKRQLIFEPFFTTKDVGSGTGLGLSIVYDIIKLHQGKIMVEDTAPGCSILIELPVLPN